jgi:glucosyl-3-phosphoglycerate synthase
LLVRPLLNKFFPRLKGFIQPLGGVYAIRRSVLEKIPMFTGYSGDVILPIDIQRIFGLAIMAQVDLGKIVHKHQKLSSLSNASFGILHTILTRVNMKGKIIVINKSNNYSVIETKKNEHGYTYTYKKKKFYEKERPPMITIQEYRKRFQKGEFKARKKYS